MITTVINAFINGAMYGSFWGIIAIGFTLVFGVMNYVNFAQGFFVLIMAYLSYFLFVSMGLDPFISLVFIVPLSFALGMLFYKYLGAPVIKDPHSTHIALTIGVCFFIQNFILLIAGADMRSAVTAYTSSTFNFGPIIISYSRLLASIASIITIILLFIVMRSTDIGKSMRAAADNRKGALIVGIHVERVYMIAFGLSTVIAGIAGTTMIPFYLMSPASGMEFLTKAFAAVIIGGLGSIPGAVIGGLIIGIVESLAAVFFKASLGNSFTCLIMILVLIFKPNGLFGDD